MTALASTTSEYNRGEYRYTHARPTWNHSLVLPAIRHFLAGLPPNAKVIDLGCGNGSLISNFFSNGWQLYGVEASASGIDQASKNYPNVRFFMADATRPMSGILEPGTFDAVISVEVIEHIYDPRGFVANAASLLKPGATLLLTTPYHGYMKSLAIALAGKTDAHYNPLWDGGHIKFWSPRTIVALLEEFGFTDLTVLSRGRIPLFWKSMVVRAAKRI